MNHKNYIIGNLPSYKFDKELNSVIKNCKFCSYCDGEQSFSGDYAIRVFCYKFVNNLEKIHDDLSINSKLKDKRCNDLIYWWYYNLYYIYTERYVSGYADIANHFKEVRDKIEHFPGISTDKLCNNFFKKLLPLATYENMKKVSDYCENYEFIEDKLKEPKNDCTLYYHYLVDSSELYNNNVSQCHVAENSYCLDFNNCHDYTPEKLLKNEKCNKIRETEKENAILEKEAEQLVPCPRGFGCVPDDIINTSITFSDYRFISLIVLSFTPTGSFLNNILHRKNIIRKNIHEEEYDELLESDSEDTPINFNNREYLITYNHE
ncbi:PIR Superfamily Protein [Plasmodium ovale wallikeri]|uniref:PIR Superfamily Protein n=1 Tax=Plasmodium ovale wallikeri TaxID=864142 RepID=A0A1A9AQV3_PLAOA|nr:PIR Superfamily Protein [Plasmodium ovale wallikeri]